jgi:AAA15 family ATPase/GTPase
LAKQLSSIKFGSKISINKEHKNVLEANTLWNNTVLGGYLKTNFESNELQEVVDWFGRRLISLITPKMDLLNATSNLIDKGLISKSNVVEFLARADFKITNIVIKEEVNKERVELLLNNSMFTEEHRDAIMKQATGKKVFFQHTIRGNDKDVSYMLPYEEESQGTQRYYQFSGLLDLMLQASAIVPIDELESSLHPDLLEHFILSFLVNTQSSQMIATTHYREFLMKKDIFRNDAIWFTDKKEDGSTDLYALTDFDSSIVRNTSSIYNAYKIGKLGAVPNLGDTYIDTTDGAQSE